MDEKKSFFELLDAKSALIVGVVGGILCLGTIGFVVLAKIMWLGRATYLSGSDVTAQVAAQQAAVATQQVADTTPPANIPKAARPKVELFVMSYCPYGLQMEKAYLPAYQLLAKKADMDIKFVFYAMHGQKEVEENTRQYCIQKGQPAKFAAYLNCFAVSGDSQSCLGSTGVNNSALETCVASANKQFGIMDKFNDKSSWLSGQFPIYPIHQDLNKTYGVQGSPTLVINGVQADVARTPEAVKQAICASFTNAPSECGQTLANVSFQPGFGSGQDTTGANAQAPGCGT